jgi:hypothetical protein
VAWRATKLYVTLKVHVMECHVWDFNDKFRTGDTEEFFIKQDLQIGANENSRYACLTNFVKRTESALNYRSKVSHPLVVKQKAEVLSGTK